MAIVCEKRIYTVIIHEWTELAIKRIKYYTGWAGSGVAGNFFASGCV